LGFYSSGFLSPGWVLCFIKLARVSSKKPWISVGQLVERITDHQRVSGWSLGFIIMALQKIEDPILVYNHGSQNK
jgi:hypothetical protein